MFLFFSPDHEQCAGARATIVLATDMAETAVFIPGIAYVVDSGVLSEDPLQRVSKGGGKQAGSGGRRRRPGALPPTLHGGRVRSIRRAHRPAPAQRREMAHSRSSRPCSRDTLLTVCRASSFLISQ